MEATAVEFIARQDWLEQVSEAVTPLIKKAFESAGEAGQQAKNFLNGVWLGHPLHPVLTDLPLGAWTVALALDTTEAATGHREWGYGADGAVTVGLVGAVGAAITGMTDWSDTYGRAKRVGLVHGLLNLSAAAMYLTSLMQRRKGSREAARGSALAGYSIALTAAYLGGNLVYEEQIGVDHTAAMTFPADFVAVLPENELPEDTLKKVMAKGVPVLLVRHEGQVRAMVETCAHLGGPLSEGKLENGSVICPWHASRFDLRDGHIIHGPSTHPQPCFETRIRNGQIEVRGTKRTA